MVLEIIKSIILFMPQLKKQNLAFVDTEATGLDVDRHELIEIGCVLVEQHWGRNKKPLFKILESFELKIKPEHIETADHVSLRVSGYDPLLWKDALSKKEAMKIFSKKTEGAIMVGHNVTADHMFIDKAFRTLGVPNKMHYHKLDTSSIAFAKLHLNDTVDKYSLHFLCDHFSIDNKSPHRALSDAEATFALYKKLMAL